MGFKKRKKINTNNIPAADREAARWQVRQLENEANYNEDWAPRLTGKEQQNAKKWAGEDRKAAAELRRKYKL